MISVTTVTIRKSPLDKKGSDFFFPALVSHMARSPRKPGVVSLPVLGSAVEPLLAPDCLLLLLGQVMPPFVLCAAQG